MPDKRKEKPIFSQLEVGEFFVAMLHGDEPGEKSLMVKTGPGLIVVYNSDGMSHTMKIGKHRNAWIVERVTFVQFQVTGREMYSKGTKRRIKKVQV